MHRIDGDGHVGNLFVEGDPGIGQQATVVTAAWANDMQEELMSLLTAASVSPVKGTQNQVLAALRAFGLLGGAGGGLGQFKFPATQNPSADANTLDDYEEGSFTPLIGGVTSESGQTYVASGQVGRYIKIGRLVHVHGRVQLSAKGTITGNVAIKGLPFASDNVTNLLSVSALSWGGLANTFTNVIGVLPANTSRIEVRGTTVAAANNDTALVTGDLTNDALFAFSAVYPAAA